MTSPSLSLPPGAVFDVTDEFLIVRGPAGEGWSVAVTRRWADAWLVALSQAWANHREAEAKGRAA